MHAPTLTEGCQAIEEGCGSWCVAMHGGSTGPYGQNKGQLPVIRACVDLLLPTVFAEQ